MRFVLFVESLVSCWNHGNAHFLRGVVRELISAGHEVRVHEPADGWSRAGMLAEPDGPAVLATFPDDFPGLSSSEHRPGQDLSPLLDGADVVVVHEWNTPALVAAVGRARRQGGRFVALFHDTHHRTVSDPDAIRAFDLSGYDGILAFGAALAEVYRGWGWGDQVHVWHEAADTRLFRPPDADSVRDGVVWIGNFGDGERSHELEEFLLRPAASAGLPLDVHGVRYPQSALTMLARHGARYRGWLANARAPARFATARVTVHVPRRFYATALPGVPTIRVFEALACGIPLVCAPWQDSEGLFRGGVDYLIARDGGEMERLLRAVANDADLRAFLVASGLDTVRARHTTAHRAAELVAIVAQLRKAA